MLVFHHAILNTKSIAWIDTVLAVKDINVIFRKNETILILISAKRYFSHPEKSTLKSYLTLRRHCNSGPRSCFLNA